MGFDVSELFVSFTAALSSEPAAGNSSWGEGRLRFRDIVHEAKTASHLVDYLLSSSSAEHGSSQAIASAVGQSDSVGIVLDSEELEDWAEELLVPWLIGTLDNRDGEEGGLHFGALPSNLVGFGEGLKLLVEVISEILSGQWTHSSGL